MKHGFWILALLLVLPLASAEPAPQSLRAFLVQGDGAVEVTERFEWRISNGTTYEPVAHAYVPTASQAVSVTFANESNTDAPQAVASEDVSRSSGAEGYDTLTIDLSGVQATAGAGTTYTVSVTYEVAGQEIRLRAYYGISTLTLTAVPRAGYEPMSPDVDLAAISETQYHGGRSSLAAGDETTVVFSPVAGAPVENQDLTKWVWGLSGLILGMILMFVVVRQGWFKSGARGPKFVKGGAMESRAMLEARRRTLLAALKELEQARETGQVPDDAYAPLKEEYKAQAVRVMRSLEEKRE